jgi:TonB family protein
MKGILSTVVCVTAFGLLASMALAQESAPKTLSGGVLNGKATSLPKPPYPPAARAVGASGAVTVQVLIDENGDVISASAVSGHPLLKAAAVQAARGAKFSPTKLEGAPVKVSGVITYNFVGALYLARLAFVVSHAERTSSFGKYSAPASLAYQLPADWEREREILNSLTFEETPKPAQKIDDSKAQPKGEENYTAQPPDVNRYTVKGDVNFSAASTVFYGPRKLDAKSVAAVRTLLDLIEQRSSVNSSATWSFELGKAIASLVADIDDQTKFQTDLAVIESLAVRAPSGVTQYSLQKVAEFVEFCKKEGLRDDNREEIISKAEMLSNLRY